MLIDSHCHLDFSDFDRDREALWKQCQQLHIRYCIIPGVKPSQWPQLLKLHKKLNGCFYAAGVHPWFIDKAITNMQDLVQQLSAALQQPGCVAIGECGLDKQCDINFDLQIKVFKQHCELAEQLQLPLIIHSRKTHSAVLAILKQFHLPAGGVIHAFSGSYQQAKEFWQQSFYLGVGGTITYPRARKTIKAISQMPLQSLLLETDSPDMPLCGMQGQRNTPLHLPTIAQRLAELKGLSKADVHHQTTANCLTLFKKIN